MTTYASFAQKTRSEKVTLITAEAVEQVKLFTVHSGAVYVRNVEHFVVDVRVFGLSLTKATSTTLVAGQYYFDPKQLKLYVRMIDDSDPKTKSIALYYRFFFSNAPYNLPYDLNNGEQVEFQARVQSIGSLGQQLDDQNTGIVLESSSNVTFENTDGYFDSIFDTLIWENQSIKFYSWSPSIPVSEARKLFEGVIESKDFSLSQVSFSVKDYVFRLKNVVDLPLFTSFDGELTPSLINRPKRRIYGKVKNAKCAGIDNTLSGYPLTGTISISSGTSTITGTGTSFLDELSPGDEIFVSLTNGEVEKVTIDSIASNTSATAGSTVNSNITAASATVKPSIPWRKKNRRWHVAGHMLHEPTATIIVPTNSVRYFVDNTRDFEPGDIVEVNGFFVEVRRISGENLVLSQSVFPVPTTGDVFTKSPVSAVYFGDKELIVNRDWLLTNNASDAIIEIDELAEFNIAPTRTVGVNMTFTNASRTITTASNVDLRTIMKPRDWIAKDSLSDPDFYEILDVAQQTVTIRTAFTGTTQTTSAKFKSVTIIDDDSLITVDCIGKADANGVWVKTAADTVKDLVINDANFETVDTEAFAQADADCPHTISMVIPESIGGESPLIRDVITKINESVMGSLYGNASQEIAFSILNARRPTDMQIIRDDDIISWDSQSDQKIVNRVKANYRPYIDVFNGSDAYETIDYTNEFVDTYIGIKNSQERLLYLYDELAATAIAQRIAFQKSLSNSKITIKTKLNLATISVNDKLVLEMDRLFTRFSGRDAKKISIVSGFKKNGADTEVDLVDLGNIFNRVPSIAPNTTPAYSLASRDEVVRYGFILDNETLTPNVSSETDLGSMRIG